MDRAAVPATGFQGLRALARLQHFEALLLKLLAAKCDHRRIVIDEENGLRSGFRRGVSVFYHRETYQDYSIARVRAVIDAPSWRNFKLAGIADLPVLLRRCSGPIGLPLRNTSAEAGFSSSQPVKKNGPYWQT